MKAVELTELDILDERAWRGHAGMFAWPTVLLLGAVLGVEVAIWWAALNAMIPLWVGGLLASVPSYAAFTVAHEAAHENIHGGDARYKRVNDLCGWIASVFLFAPYEAFKVIHLTHHAHTNDPDHDPDHWVVGASALGVAARCWTILPHYYADYLWGRTSKLQAARSGRALTIAATLVLVALFGVGVWAGLWLELLALWVLPAIFASGFLALVFDWLPHHPHDSQERFHDTRVLLVTPLTLPLLWQNYHLIHHLYPRVPFYRYGTCFDEVRPLLEAKGAPIQDLRGELNPRPSATPTLELRVTALKEVAQGMLSVTFEPDQALRWTPGQFITLGLPVGDDELIWRCYSIHDPERLSVAVRLVHQGKGSGWIHAHLREGMILQAKAPAGDFSLDPACEAQHLVLIAGGSGITPLLAILKAALGAAPNAPQVTLIYGARQVQDLAFIPELEQLLAAHPERLELRYVLEQPPASWDGGIGRLDARELARHLEIIDHGLDAEFFLCGPAGMMAQARELLEGRGVMAAHIHAEQFVPVQAQRERVGPAQPVVFELGGHRSTLQVPAEQTLLDAAIEAKLPVSYACRSGRCGSCVMRQVSGELELTPGARAQALLDSEREQGLFLPCITHAASPCHISERS